jgi:thiamine-phosphate pyrophosphorylase
LSPVPLNSLPASPGRRPAAPVLCYVTGRNSLALEAGGQPDALLPKINAAIDAGIDWIQIREKDLPAAELMSLAQEAVRSSRAHKTRIIVNDRLDVAIEAQAAGVHLGRASKPAREIVEWCRNGNAPQEFLVGVSCHSLEEVREAADAGASYTIFGPVFDTPSKRAFGHPAGPAQLAAVCATVAIPVLAIGGVDLQNAGECLRAGAAGIAAIRMFQDARDAEELKITIRLLRELKSAPGSPTR